MFITGCFYCCLLYTSGGRYQHPVGKISGHGHGAQLKALPHGGTGPVEPEHGEFQVHAPEGGGDQLGQEIASKIIPDLLLIQPALFNEMCIRDRAAPMFMESLKSMSTIFPVVIPATRASGLPPPPFPRTTAPQPVTVHVAESGLWFPSVSYTHLVSAMQLRWEIRPSCLNLGCFQPMTSPLCRKTGALYTFHAF